MDEDDNSTNHDRKNNDDVHNNSTMQNDDSDIEFNHDHDNDDDESYDEQQLNHRLHASPPRRQQQQPRQVPRRRNEEEDQRGLRRQNNVDHEEEGAARAAARQRNILVPLESQLLHSRLITRTSEASIDNLIGDQVFLSNRNLNRQFINAQLLRIITPTRDMKAQLYAIRNRNRNGNSSSETNFTRIYLLRIISSTNLNDHGRLFYLLESRNSNATLFNRNIDFRDNGTITIGTIVRVVGPQEIECRMGDIFLIKTPNPLIVMQRPLRLPTYGINNDIQANHSMAFCLNDRILHVNQTFVVQTTCSGLMCDKGRVEDWNGTKGCGCVGMNHNISNLALIHSIWFETNDGNNDGIENVTRRITHSNFSSTKFSLCYLTSRIPSSIRQSVLSATGGDGNNCLWDIEDAVERVRNYVNAHGGWTIIGWYKRGAIRDRSLVGESGGDTGNNRMNANGRDEIVGAGQLNFHIVELLPTDRRFLDKTTSQWRALNLLKYDVSQLNNTMN